MPQQRRHRADKNTVVHPFGTRAATHRSSRASTRAPLTQQPGLSKVCSAHRSCEGVALNVRQWRAMVFNVLSVTSQRSYELIVCSFWPPRASREATLGLALDCC
jgi:hypothetical protein